MLRLEPILAALVTFAVVFAVLRAVEWLYHRWRHNADYSPHWGSWLFAVLAAIFMLVNELGR
jgi:hypothetical protein